MKYRKTHLEKLCIQNYYRYELYPILNLSPYSLKKEEKEKLHIDYLNKLTRHHLLNCVKYRKMLNAIDFDKKKL